MANNAYLLRSTGTETECLFESHTTIPYFWFPLINTRVIKKVGEEIHRLFQRSSRRIMSNSHTTIKLPTEYMLKNAERGKIFCREFQPSLLNIYNDFTGYMGSVFAEGDTLELNIIEITDFASTVRSMSMVRDVVRSIQLGEEANRYFEIYGPDRDPLTLAGDDRSYRNEFRNYSAPYAEFCDEVEKELRQKPWMLGEISNKIKNLLGGEFGAGTVK
ncbi:MAG: hypothetical protein LBT39_01245 [Treponema sp.]|jgi:hypothetical protein|nr:hypothetical protein [Treponema sp.]